MSELTSPQGSIELAIAALLLVLGFRFARPSRPREWVAVAAYAAGLAGHLLGASGLLRGSVFPAGTGLRILGALGLVAGLILAGAPARSRRRASSGGHPGPGATAATAPYAGLALVLAGQFLRAPSSAGLVPALVGIAVNAWAALRSRRDAAPVDHRL